MGPGNQRRYCRFAIGIAISPIPIIAIILILFLEPGDGERARVSCSVWIAGLAVVGTAVYLFFADAPTAATDSTTSDSISWGKNRARRRAPRAWGASQLRQGSPASGQARGAAEVEGDGGDDHTSEGHGARRSLLAVVNPQEPESSRWAACAGVGSAGAQHRGRRRGPSSCSWRWSSVFDPVPRWATSSSGGDRAPPHARAHEGMDDRAQPTR